MDFFGIGAAMKSMQRVYIQSARGSGRTTSMVESLKDGDRVIFSDSRERERVERMCKERGVDVKCITQSPNDTHDIFKNGTSQCRTIFDHQWVEQFYINAIELASDDIDLLQKELSGFGEAHLETRRQAYEIMKWKL